jgi:hypothetical protein
MNVAHGGHYLQLNLVWAVLLTVGAIAIMITAMLRLRRRAPEGGYFASIDRAASVFGLLGTAFAVLLGFMIFLAFSRYDASRASAQAEALVVAQQFEAAQLMPPDVRVRLSGELICYARSVVALEWPLIAQDVHPPFNPWVGALLRTLQTIEPRTASEQSAYSDWLSLTSRRAEERRHRLHGGEFLVPRPVWLVLLFSAAVILLYLLFFADSGERAVVQALMAGSVTGVVVASLLLLAVLNRPYQRDVGGLGPDAMQHTLEIIDEARRTLGVDDEPLPCDQAGRSSGDAEDEPVIDAG